MRPKSLAKLPAAAQHQLGRGQRQAEAGRDTEHVAVSVLRSAASQKKSFGQP